MGEMYEVIPVEAAICTLGGAAVTEVTVNGVLYSGESYSTWSSAASSGYDTVVIQDRTISAALGKYEKTLTVILDRIFAGSLTSRVINTGSGNAFVISGSLFAGNSVTSGNSGVFNGASGTTLTLCGSTSVNELGKVEIIGNTFSSNSAPGMGGVMRAYDAEISNTKFLNNSATGNGGALYLLGTRNTIGDNTVFDGNSSSSNGGAVYFYQGTNRITGNVKFLTANDSIYLRASSSLEIVDANLTLNAKITAESGVPLISVQNSTIRFDNDTPIDKIAGLTFSGDNKMIFSGTAAVKFTNQDLSSVAITEDAGNYAGSVAIATGVTAFGGYGITGTDDRSLFLTLNSVNSLMLYSRTPDLADGTTKNLIGDGSVYMTGGTITNVFVGTNALSGSARTIITGGEVDNSLVGGALVTAGSSAALDAVTLELDGGELIGGTANGGMNYVAGYVYGDNSALPGTPNYTVGKVAATLAGATVDGNLYAGAHARKYGYASVGETSVTVKDGYCNKLYGGGWAERGSDAITGGTAAMSKVGAATIEISGGTVDYVYAGGGNSYYGYTEVGNADIAISGGAVQFVFLGGRNINCSVTGTATLTVSGTAQEMVRVSGHNGSGQAMTGTSVLNVETDLTLGYLDFVDVINLSEKCLLDVTDLTLYESGSAATLNFVTDGFTGDWDAVSGTAYEMFQEAQFQVNGIDVVRDDVTGNLGDSGYRLTFDEDNKKFILNQIA